MVTTTRRLRSKPAGDPDPRRFGAERRDRMIWEIYRWRLTRTNSALSFRCLALSGWGGDCHVSVGAGRTAVTSKYRNWVRLLMISRDSPGRADGSATATDAFTMELAEQPDRRRWDMLNCKLPAQVAGSTTTRRRWSSLPQRTRPAAGVYYGRA